MFSYFRCELMGIVTSDLDVRNRRNGGALVKFNIGVVNSKGETFNHAVVAKDDVARHALQHVKCGSVVIAHGFLSSFYVEFTDHLGCVSDLVEEVVLTDIVAFNRHDQAGFSKALEDGALHDED